MLSRIRDVGPGMLVAAAFIGPGTVTACTLAGANFGYTLLWALLFATIATIILQEMSARLGTVSKLGLGEILINELRTGAALGIEAIAGESSNLSKFSILALALFAIVVLLRSSYKVIEKVLIGLVLLMGVAFILTFFVVQPSLLGVLGGLFKPSMPDGSTLTVIALIGTTVVPYNLFLHASTAKIRWDGEKGLKAARSDTVISIGLGGLVAIMITSTAAASIYANALSVQNAADMAVQFEPLFGSLSKYLLGIGLFAAGLSSAITAPLATSFAISELLEVEGGQESAIFKSISISIIVIGSAIALTGIKPIKLILLAQFANGMLLPIVACFLLYALNRKNILGDYTNGALANTLGVGVVIFTAAMGTRLILKSLGVL